MMKEILFTLFAISVIKISIGEKMHKVYQWKYLDYDIWENDNERDAAERNATYISVFNVPYDVQKVEDGRYFISIARLEGVPVTLGTISDKKGEGGPLISPYPDLASQLRNEDKSFNCENIISVFRMKVDTCNRLWVIDTGLFGGTSVCPAKILAFDLKLNKLVKRIDIPRSLETLEESTFDNLVVRTEYGCDNFQVYVTETLGPGLIIYNNGAIWRVQSKSFEHEDNASVVPYMSDNITMPFGILPISMGRCPVTGKSALYYNAVAGFKMYYALEDELLFTGTCKDAMYTEMMGPDDLPCHVWATAITEDNIMIMGLLEKSAVACHNLKLPSTPETLVILDQDEVTLEDPFAVKIIGPPHDSTLLVLSNRYRMFQSEGIIAYFDNFFITEGNLNKLLEGTNCRDANK